jgi:murein DD-endopeptidase MepM/ murein hydrolase activator NlpD
MRYAAVLLTCSVLTACGSGGTDTVAPPVTIPVASVSISAPTVSLTVGATSQLSVATKDAQGNVLSGRAVVWSSVSSAIATVTDGGLVTGAAAGSSWVRATSEGKSDSTRITVTAGAVNVAAFLSRPFAGEFITVNPMDHDTPEEFIDTNNIFTSSWGESIKAFSSHSGYDYVMPTGTTLLAAAAGTVRFAGSSNFFCPILSTNVDQKGVIIVHNLPGGAQYETYYAHLSRVDVTVGQSVAVGSTIGLSGNTGCTSYPHLHFQLDRMTGTNNGARASVDPYGWTGTGTDPWESSPRGAKSLNLWLPGQAPLVQIGLDSISFTINGPSSGPSKKPVVINAFVFVGNRDDQNPNNEYVELKTDPSVFTGASYDLTGHSIKNNAGDRYTFPAGTTLSAAAPLRVYSGSGTNSATRLYWGKPAGVYSNLGDCAQLFFPNGSYYLIGNVACR